MKIISETFEGPIRTEKSVLLFNSLMKIQLEDIFSLPSSSDKLVLM